MKKALIVVDVQNDFCPGGSLAVAEGDKIIPLINDLMDSGEYDCVVATQDFHPADHSSFVSNNPNSGIWPDHCVQNTFGAEMHSLLDVKKINKIFPKGTNPKVDSYSGFFDNDKQFATGLGEWLQDLRITHVDIVGLALDYCVKATAEDAHSLGFKTTVILKATRSVNLKPNDGEDAVKHLQTIGVVVRQN